VAEAIRTPSLVALSCRSRRAARWRGCQGRPGRHRAPVRAAQLGRAGLQAGQRRARLGRLPGPKRPGDPPTLGAGLLRVQLLLAGLSRRTTPSAPVPGRPGGRAGGAGDRSSRRNRPRGGRGQWRCARCGAWLTHGACCNAAGGHGRQHRRPSSCNCCLTPLPPARRYPSTFRPDQQTTDTGAWVLN
jgi:hypothetical protein